jgi:ADP-L-glycero-D-manno-heptose 6-epimerase
MTDLSQGRILVTGGAGFIGSAIVWELNRRGLQNILIADFLRDGDKWKNLPPLRFADYMEADDLLDIVQNSASSLADIRTIFHLGACSATTETDATYLIRNNYNYTKTLARFALESGRRFIYASSAATYGSLERGLSESVDLNTLRPLNMYGYSKHLFDLYAAQNQMLPRLTGIKYFNIFGPNEDHKGDMRSVVHKAFHQIRETGHVSLFKSYRPEFHDGGQRRDFLYIKDAVAATVFLAEHADGGGLFNVGSGEANTWLNLAHALFAGLGQKPAIDFIEMPDVLREKYQYFTCADITKLRQAGFVQPMTPLADAVAEYVRYYLLPGKHLGDERTPTCS